jgi:hypothetical protein
MADTEWHIEGKYIEFCSCDHGCPCEAMAPPTHGVCEGLVGMHIDKGHWGDVNMDGVLIITTFFFPRAIHHGGGRMQPILQDHTSEEQRAAIFAIMSGEGQPVGSMFNIFSVIVEEICEPQFTKIEFEWDVKKRTARIHAPNLLNASAKPIRNPVTDDEVHIRTVLPDGWVFHEAELASGDVKSIGDIRVDHTQRHSSLGFFAFNNNGMARSYSDTMKDHSLDALA